MAVYEDKKIEAEATLQQQELRALERGIEIKRIIPSFGRLSIFELMNQSVGSVINDFKKLNLDSSTSSSKISDSNDTSDSEIKSDSIKFQSNIKDEIKVKTNDSSIINDNNTDNNKNIIIKGDNDNNTDNNKSILNKGDNDNNTDNNKSILIKGDNDEVNKKRRIN